MEERLASLKERLAPGRAAFERDAFFEAHELWEVVWRDEAHPVMKAFLQGLILVAAGMHKLEKMGSVAGAVRLLQNAGARLAEVPEGTGGMAIGLLRSDIARATSELERLSSEGSSASPEGTTSLDVALVPRMEPFGKTLPS